MSFINQVDRLARMCGLEPKATAARRTAARASAIPAFIQEMGLQGEWGQNNDPTVYENQALRYTRSPGFYAAVNRVAESAAMAKCAVFAGPEEDAQPIPDHPFMDLLRRPAPSMEWLGLDRFTVLESIVSCMIVTGEHSLYLGDRNSPKQPPGMLLPLRTDRIEPLADKKLGLKGYRYTIGYTQFDIPVEDIVHWKRWNPVDDFRGLSAVEPANYAMATDIAAQKHNWAAFKNGLRVSMLVESDRDNIDKTEKDLMEQYIRDSLTGDPEKAFQILFLWQGFKAKDLGANLRDAEYSEGRRLNLRDILMVVGVHPAIMLTDDVPLANARIGEYLLAKYTLLPLLTRVAMRLNAEVLPLYGEGHELRFLNVVPRDVEQEIKENQAYLDRGATTPNEVRKAQGRDPLPWGNVPASMVEKAVTVNEARKWMELEPLEGDAGELLLAQVTKGAAPTAAMDSESESQSGRPGEGTATDDLDAAMEQAATDSDEAMDVTDDGGLELSKAIGRNGKRRAALQAVEADAILQAAARVLARGELEV